MRNIFSFSIAGLGSIGALIVAVLAATHVSAEPNTKQIASWENGSLPETEPSDAFIFKDPSEPKQNRIGVKYGLNQSGRWIVESVAPGSPADKAGVEAGKHIVIIKRIDRRKAEKHGDWVRGFIDSIQPRGVTSFEDVQNFESGNYGETLVISLEDKYAANRTEHSVHVPYVAANNISSSSPTDKTSIKEADQFNLDREEPTTNRNASTSLTPVAAQAEINPKHHKLCLEARDYSGCIKAMTGEDTENPSAERCWKRWGQYLCIAKRGLDHFGLPKVVGSIYITFDDGSINYIDWDGSRHHEDGNPIYNEYLVPHKGQKRYIAEKFVGRFSYAGTAGTASRSYTIGSGSTNCYTTGSVGTYGMYGGSTSCTSTPPTTVNIPGSSGTPGGISSRRGVYIYDCKDRTYAFYYDGRLSGRWSKMKSTDPLNRSCNDYDFDSMPVLRMKL